MKSLHGSDYVHEITWALASRDSLVSIRAGTGDLEPCHSVLVLGEEVFQRGRSSPERGGPKGIDIDRSGRIVALTCAYQRLALFDLDELCPPPAS